MKVTVCFGPVSVVVPCGNGDILVRDLISQAVTRYRKASNKSNDAAISVAALRSSDGAILDPDDRLADVVDDREQLAACLSNGGGGGSGSELDEPSLGVPLVLGPRIGLMNLRGDGTSASSNSGSPSPTDFGLHHHHGYGVVSGSSHPASRKDIEVTGQEAATGLMVDHLHLQVRRGSEPALNRISPDAPSNAPNTTGSSSSSASTGHHLHHADMPPTTSNSRDYKRWSAAPIVDPTSDSDCEERDLEVVRRHPSGPRFARSGARVSMQIFGGGVGSAANGGSHNNAGYRWAEAADNALLSAATAPGAGAATPTATTPPDYEETMHRRTRSLRREPVGATSESIPLSDGHHHLYQPHHLNNNNNSNNMQSQLASTQLVVLPNEGGQPLGIHVVPDYSPLGNELGLLVQGVEPGGRIYRDGRIAVHDRIVEINSHPLKDVPFHRAQELFRNALQSRDLRLRIVKSNGEANRGPASEQMDEMTQQQQQQQPTTQQQQQQTQQQQQAPSSRVAAVSPTRKTPAVVPGTGRASNALMTVSTRKIGKKLDLELTKGHEGLGFSVTTRDNPAGGLCPIYIKNILPRGAAIEDGRLRSGDRLLEVNGVEMTGKTQSEVVSLLRNIPSGGVARLLISRQETEEEIQQSNQLQNQQVQSSSSSQLQSSTQTQQTSPKLPRQMKSISRASEESLLLLPWKQREILTLDIPVHDTEKAGLGISVKGKTTSSSGNGTSDLGIFIKSVLHGGAASRDGRLCTNDQLLHVNGVSLQGRSNTEAMEGLRRAVHQEGPKPGHITLTVARKMHALKDREVTLEGQSQDDTVNGTVRLGGNGGDSSGSYDHSGGSSDQSGSTVIFVSGSGSDSRERNLMKDNRLSGISSDLRNESYYRATHETWNTTQLQETLMSSSKSNGGHQTSVVQGPGRKQHSQNSPTVHLTPGEVVSIDGDYLPQSRPRPPSMMMMSTSNGSSVASTPDTTMNLPWQQQHSNNNNIRGPGGQRSGPTDGRDRPWPNAEQPQPPQSPLSETSMRSDGRPSDSEAPTYTSQTSLDTDPNAPGFSRDQFGRQSMSEKRHASLDAKNTDTYQRNKKLREERERQKQTQPESEQQQQPQTSAVKENMPPSDKSKENSRPLFVRPVDPPSRSSSRDIGPTLGLKKSSSLESLQTVVQEIQMQEEEPQIGCYGYHRPTAIRVVRGRGCNESFRAAVDRSYDESGQPTDGTNKEPMETLDEALEVELNEMMPPPRSPSDIGIPMLNNKNETRKSKKKNANAAGLLLKGLGSMFRFGKHRKSAPASPESGHQSSGSDPTVSGHHSMAGGHMIMPSSGNQSHHYHHQSERRSSSGHSGSIGRSSAVSEVDRHHVLRRTLPPDERDRAELGRQMAIAVARQAAQDEQKRIQHHYLRLMDQQQRQAAAAHDHQQKQQQQQQLQQQGNSTTTTGDSANRSQRLHQLRAQHQKRHAEQQRQSTHTPTEQFESNNKNVPEIIHGRSASYDPYNDVRKPRSRAAVGEPNTLMPIPAVPSSTSNYNNNYDEFQLNRRQQHYHSQRSARETRMSPPGGNGWSGADRPVSNYFEYESLHIAGHKVALSGPPYKPQQQQQQQSGNRRPPTVQGDDTTFFRRPDRNSTGHEYGSNQGRASQRESVYGASNYGSGSQNNPSRPAPLTGSKV